MNQPTKQVRRAIWERDSGICGLCALPVEFGPLMHIDRIDPSIRGYENTNNLHPTHGVCNQKKGAAERSFRHGGPDTFFTLRLPTEIHEELTAAAKDEDRSLNAQIVYVLRQWIAEQKRRRAATEGTPS